MKKTIFETKDKTFRILEIQDTNYDIEDLKGDTYSPTENPDIPRETLETQEKEFNSLVESEGVFGYVLEKWDPTPGTGWTHVDSCWGFVGHYRPDNELFNHYVVSELIAQTEEVSK